MLQNYWSAIHLHLNIIPLSWQPGVQGHSHDYEWLESKQEREEMALSDGTVQSFSKGVLARGKCRDGKAA